MNVDQLKAEFKKNYGEETGTEASIYFSPGRVNLIGEHTDYNGGYVFPCALSFGTYLVIRVISDKVIKFKSLNQKYTATVSMDDIEKHHGKEWVNYPLGVVNQFISHGGKIDKGLEMLFWGNVPNGAGLSSSASIEVVTSYALNDIFQSGFDRIALVKMARKAENEFVGVSCGIMDQFASGMGKKDHAIFLNCDTLEYDLIPMKLNGIKVIISNTNSPHKLDAGHYNQRVSECKAAVNEISKFKPIKNLADLSWEEFVSIENKIKDPIAKKRSRHVVSEIKRTVDAVNALQSGRIEEFGKLMNASHISLRDDYEVTGPELDAMAEEAWKVKGVIGSRMTGGGFGGCTVSLVKDEAIDTFTKYVGKAYRERTGITPEFYVAEIGDGSKLVERFSCGIEILN